MRDRNLSWMSHRKNTQVLGESFPTLRVTLDAVPVTDIGRRKFLNVSGNLEREIENER